MAGDNPAEERRGDPDEFLSKPRWQRVLIALAGPTTNFLMAVVLTGGLFVHGGEQRSYADKPVVVAGVVKDSPAQKAGIQPGDKIVSFAGVKDPTWDRVALELALSAPGHSEPVTIERDGRLITTSVTSEPQPFAVLGYPAEPVVVGSVAHGLPAEPAGLKEGDVIVSANGQHLTAPSEFSEIVQQSGGNSMTVEILRNRQTQTLELRPTWRDPGGGTPRWQIGITLRFVSLPPRESSPAAVVKATQFHIVLANKLIYLVGELFTVKVSLKQVQGTIEIVTGSIRAAEGGV